MRTLLLTPWMVPHKIISWQRAVVIFSRQGRCPRGVRRGDPLALAWRMRTPAVVRLKRSLGGMKRGVKFSRVNVFTRDEFRCQYCGEQKPMGELNYDHVVPRVQGGKTIWENIVTSCYDCNDRKGGRTPEQAGMKLRKRPIKPRIASPSHRSFACTAPRCPSRGCLTAAPLGTERGVA